MNQCPSCASGLLSVRDVAELAGLSEMAIYRAIHDGELKAAKLRGKLRIRPQDFERWIDESSVEPTGTREPIAALTRAKSAAAGGSGLRDLLKPRELAEPNGVNRKELAVD
jgi:excisionase family DNA binding protein